MTTNRALKNEKVASSRSGAEAESESLGQLLFEAAEHSAKGQPEPFCEETFITLFRAASVSDDPHVLDKISVMFSRSPQLAWQAVDKICEEKAQEATIATREGNFPVAAEAIESHRALATVYSKLIAAKMERLSVHA